MNSKFWFDKNVLITGVNGLIGTHLAEKLSELKANVIGLQIMENFNSDYLMNLSGVQLVNGSVLDYPLMERLVIEKEIDSVIHLAGVSVVGESNQNPIEALKVNIEGTWNALELARKNELIERTAIASTSRVYKNTGKKIFSEEDALGGNNLYDSSKVCADELSRTYAKTYGLKIGITRCANTFGGNEIKLNNFIPIVISGILKNGKVELYGDGKPERHYLYVKDTANAYLSLLENLDKKNVQGEAFNFATETPVSLKQLAEKIVSLSGKKTKIEWKTVPKERLGEWEKFGLSSAKAKKLLNWKTEYSLEKGLKETIEWFEKNKEGMK